MPADLDAILRDLNPPQREAVLHGDGPLLVLAGAGSGKTRVITRRIARLQATGTPVDGILAITFTNKAAGEMRARAEALTGRRSPWIATFHSFAARILRRHISRLEPYDPSFTICDSDDCAAIIKDILREEHVDPQVWQARAVGDAISRLKSDCGGDPEALGSDFRHGQTLRRVYLAYRERMEQRNLLDFDDLLLLVVRLWREHPDVLESHRAQFEHVLVDEYQDTNALQYTMCRLLTTERSNICITGDPDQSIYRWRGADISNILNFERDYPATRVILLEQNYRSTRNILHAANNLIAHNRERKPKELWTENGDGDPVLVSRFANEHLEASAIARVIAELRESGTALGDIAIFYRVNSLSRVLEQELIYANIPYTIVGALAFFLRKEVKDVLAMLRILDNPRDSESLKRVINTPPRGIGLGTVDRLEELARATGKSLLEVVLEPELRADLPARTAKAIDGFRSLYLDLAASRTGGVAACLEAVLDKSGYRKHLESSTGDDAADRLENIGELVGAAVEYDKAQPQGDLRGFLELTAILGDVDRWEQRADRVSLLSIHAAKGLEFGVVLIAGCEDSLLPLMRAGSEPNELEEERRLFYVGLTRAKERLFLTHAATRTRFGRPMASLPSRFLLELEHGKLGAASAEVERLRFDLATQQSLWRRATGDPEAGERAVEDHEAERSRSAGGWPISPGRGRSRSIRSTGDPIADEFAEYEARGADEDGDGSDDFPAGSRVRHAEYGEGEVLRSSGFGRQRRVTVRFDDFGVKQFVVAFTNLSRIP